MKSTLSVLLLAIVSTGCVSSRSDSTTPAARQDAATTTGVLHVEDVDWQPLNPARGDKSPQAATLWGDRNGTEATGFLVRFVDGFSSPPHIHNVSYRGVVLSGLVHNDDPDAAAMWMPTGSYWTQPKGEVHVTAAKGDVNIAYIEIEEGPYLVLPIEEAFDSGERPINVDPSNVVWLDASATSFIDNGSSEGVGEPMLAHLWGTPSSDQHHGSLLRLPPGFRGTLHAHGDALRAVVIEGAVMLEDLEGTSSLPPGSTFHSKHSAAYRLRCDSSGGTLLYIRAHGDYELVAAR